MQDFALVIPMYLKSQHVPVQPQPLRIPYRENKNNQNPFTDFTLFKIPVWHWWCLPVNKFTSFSINTNRSISCCEISKSKNIANAEMHLGIVQVNLTLLSVFTVFSSWKFWCSIEYVLVLVGSWWKTPSDKIHDNSRTKHAVPNFREEFFEVFVY